ncbi:MAG: AMP-binding protein [Propionibacteriaceae bacterium]|nr:AMP-binding protein [Propionibacteriaceae bacterium]
MSLRYPARFTQRNLYFQYAAHPDDPSPDLAFAFAISGPTNWPVLTRCLTLIGAAIPGLRTRFVMDGPVLMAEVVDTPVPVQVRQLADPVAGAVRRLEDDLDAGPMDITASSLLDICVYPGHPEGCVTVRCSHLIADAVSFVTLLGCVQRMYAAPEDQWEEICLDAGGHPGSGEPVPVLKRGKQAYEQLLAATESFTHLSLDVPGGSGRIPGSHRPILIDQTGAQELLNSEVGLSCGAPVAFMTAYAATLQRLCSTAQVTMGIPVVNRSRQAVGGIGAYINTLPLPITLERGDTWVRLADRVMAGTRVVMANQGADLMGADRDILGSRGLPALDNAVTYYSQSLGLELPGLAVRSLPVRRSAVQYPVNLTVENAGDEGFRLDLAFSSHLSAAAPHDLLFEALQTMTSQPRRAVIKASVFVSDWDRVTAGRVGRPGAGGDVIDRIRQRIDDYPGRIALTGSDEWTYGRLGEQMDRVASGLDAKQASQVVIMAVPKSAEAVAAILGILASGRAYVPVDPSGPPLRLASIVDQVVASHQGPVTILTSDGATVARYPSIALSDLNGTDSHDHTYAPHAIAYVIFTSGSTGAPKGVMIERGNISSLLDSVDLLEHFTSEDPQTWCLFHSLGFDLSVWEIFTSLTHGHTLCVPTSQDTADPQATIDLLACHQVSVLMQTPSAFRRLRDSLIRTGQTLPCLERIVLGGEPLYPVDVAAWIQAGLGTPRFVNMYGITETTVHSTHRAITAEDLDQPQRSAIGQALPGWGLTIVDEFGCVCPPAIPGEILVTGEGLAAGYLGRPDLSANKFRWLRADSGVRAYCSGDRAKDCGDTVVYMGRIDQQVQIRGYRVELEEVVAGLECTSMVRSAVARLVQPAGVEPYLAAWVVLAPGASVADVRRLARDTLPSYMIPARIIEVDSIPTTSNGKPDLTALPEPRAAGEDAEREEASDVACAIAEIWEQVIGTGHIRPSDRFMEVGGTSMHIMEIHHRVSSRFDVGWLTLVDLFAHPTPAGLAALIEQHQRPADEIRSGAGAGVGA